MKKILIVLAITGMTYCEATGRTTFNHAAGAQPIEVCKKSGDKKTISCYASKYAENFKVYRGNYGYYIVNESGGLGNLSFATPPLFIYQLYAVAQNIDEIPVATVPVKAEKPETKYYVLKALPADRNLNNKAGAIAADNRDPYLGLPSPQYQGPVLNCMRNINANRPISFSGIPIN
jgi:hypothetical protein